MQDYKLGDIVYAIYTAEESKTGDMRIEIVKDRIVSLFEHESLTKMSHGARVREYIVKLSSGACVRRGMLGGSIEEVFENFGAFLTKEAEALQNLPGPETNEYFSNISVRNFTEEGS